MLRKLTIAVGFVAGGMQSGTLEGGLEGAKYGAIFGGASGAVSAGIRGIGAYGQYRSYVRAQRAAAYADYQAQKAAAANRAYMNSAQAGDNDAYWENLGYNKLRVSRMAAYNEMKVLKPYAEVYSKYVLNSVKFKFGAGFGNGNSLLEQIYVPPYVFKSQNIPGDSVSPRMQRYRGIIR